MKESYKFKRLRHTLGSDGLQCFGNVAANERRKQNGEVNIVKEFELGTS